MKENIKKYPFKQIKPAKNKDFFICPFCHSGDGSHPNSTGALYHYPKTESENEHYFCFSCHVTIYNTTTYAPAFSSVNSEEEENKILNSEAEASKKTAFEIEKEKQLKYALHGLSKERKINALNTLFKAREYTEETISWLASQEDVIYRKKDILIPSYTLAREILGYQKLYIDVKSQKLVKLFIKNSLSKYYILQNPKNASNIYFVVESITNALAIFDCGFSAICIFSSNNATKALKDLKLNGMLKNVVLSLDYDYRDKQVELAKSYNVPYVDFSLFEHLITSNNFDASDWLQADKFNMQSILSTYNTIDYTEEKRTDSIEICLDSHQINFIQTPTASGKTRALINTHDENSLVICDSISNCNDFQKATDCKIVTSERQILGKEHPGLVTTQKRIGLNYTNCKDYKNASQEELQQYDSMRVDEVDLLFQEKSQVLCKLYSRKNQQIIDEETKDIHIQKDYFSPIRSNKEMIDAIERGDEINLYPAKLLQSNKLDEYASFSFNEREMLPPKEEENFIIIGEEKIYLSELINNIDFYSSNDHALTPQEGQNFYYIPIKSFSLKEMLLFCFDEIREEVKKLSYDSYKVVYSLLLRYARNAFIRMAIPEILEKGKPIPICFNRLAETIKQGNKHLLITPKNTTVYFQPEIVFVDCMPLVKMLQVVMNDRTKRLNFLSATFSPIMLEIIGELKQLGFDCHFHKLAQQRKLENDAKVLLSNKNFTMREKVELLKELESLKLNILFVCHKKEEAEKLAKSQEGSNFWLLKDVYSIEDRTLQAFTYEKKGEQVAKFDDETQDVYIEKNVITYEYCTFLRGSNAFANYDMIVYDLCMYAPAFAKANPWQSTIESQQSNLQVLTTQQIGREFRKEEKRIKLIIGFNYNSLKNIDFTPDFNFLSEITATNAIYKEEDKFTYGNTIKERVQNIKRLFSGEAPEHYEIATQKSQKAQITEEEKEQNQFNKLLNKCAMYASYHDSITWRELYHTFHLDRFKNNQSLREVLILKGIIKK